ncbi:MAG: hypothetical protein ACM3SR_11400 [Ignavibacteriales bacterium]
MAKKNLEEKPRAKDAQAIKLSEQFKSAWDYYSTIRETFEEKEKIVYCKPGDSLSKNSTKSQVNDPRLLTMSMERSFRVMSQLASGKVQALSKKDVGKSQFMDLILHKYIEPNASNQYDLLTKLRLVDFYSLVYGSFGVLVDYVIRDDYVGPDFSMIPIRDLIPQPGRISIEDCDYVFVKSKVTRAWLAKRDKKTWKNIDEILEASKGEKKASKSSGTDEKSYGEQNFGDEYAETGSKYAGINLVTRYERDRWITFAPDYNLILRDIENPQKNGKIPVVVKHAFPLIDRFHGLGEFEKGMSLQYATNSLINLYLDGVKFSLFPPLLIDLPNVVQSTIKMEAAAKWVVKSKDAVSQLQVSPQGINTFQSTYQFLIAALMNQAGTSDTTVSSQTDPGLGKTPQALAMLNQRQNSRDVFDRFQMEKFVEKVYDLFMDLVATKQETPIKITLFEQELQQIGDMNADVLDMFESGKAGEIIIKPSDIKDTKYKFFIDAGSTYKQDEAQEQLSLSEGMQLLLKIPGAAEQVMQTGTIQLGEKVVDFGEMYKKWLISRGIQDWEKIIKDAKDITEGGTMTPNDQQAWDQQFQNLVQQIQNGPEGQMGGLNGTGGAGNPNGQLPQFNAQQGI